MSSVADDPPSILDVESEENDSHSLRKEGVDVDSDAEQRATLIDDNKLDANESLLVEPERQVGWQFILTISLATFGIMMAFFTPIQNLLPRLVEQFEQEHKEAALGYVTGAGAFVAVVANPLAGALSDSFTTRRFGRRKPVLAVGAVGGAGAIAALPFMPNVASLAFCWALCQVFVNAAFAAVTAAIPDQVPVKQRATISGFMAISQLIGVLCGLVLVSFVVTDLVVGCLLTAAFLVLLCAPFFIRPYDLRLDPPAQPRPTMGAFLAKFWVDPRAHPDFAWAWFTRFLVALGNAMATLYLRYFLEDVVRVSNADEAQTTIIGTYAVGCIITTVIAGKLSDRSGHRKIYVIASSFVMSASAVTLAFAPHFWPVLCAAFVLGLGFGIYMSVDQALMSQVLPSIADRARHLGVLNIANSLPQVLAPVIAAPIVTWPPLGYPGMFCLAAALTALSALLVTRIHSVA